MAETPVVLPTPEADKLRADIERLKRTLPYMIEFYHLDAKCRKARYDSLISAGFTAEQALELTKHG